MMKKSIAVLIALFLICMLCFSALAEAADPTSSMTFTNKDDTTGAIPVPASTEYTKDSVTAVYRCTIDWETVDGAYSQGAPGYTWNPKTLKYDSNDDAYDAENWEETTQPSLSVTVTNFSNVGVKAEMSFAAADGITAYICDDQLAEAKQAPSVTILSAATEDPEKMVDEGLTGEEQSDTLSASFHMTDGFGKLNENGGTIGTATVTLEFGSVAETFSVWETGITEE